MSNYNSEPDLTATMRDMRSQIAALQRNTQQFVIPLARITRPASFSATDVLQVFPFTDVEFDTASMTDVSTPERITIPFTGVYHIVGNAEWDGTVADATPRRATIRLNGEETWQGQIVLAPATASVAEVCLVTASTIIRCSVGDYIEMWVKHTAPSDVIMSGGVSSLSVAWLGVGNPN